MRTSGPDSFRGPFEGSDVVFSGVGGQELAVCIVLMKVLTEIEEEGCVTDVRRSMCDLVVPSDILLLILAPGPHLAASCWKRVELD